jgi:hypothetical protein
VELKTSRTTTHFGCSFQISHQLALQALVLKNLSAEEKKKRTMTQSEQSIKKKKISKPGRKKQTKNQTHRIITKKKISKAGSSRKAQK